jgi:predicted DNA-binding protein
VRRISSVSAPKARLNFVIPNDLEESLDTYCKRTGRTSTDVVRQLVIEWLEGDRHLAEPATEHPSGRRTNLLLTHAAKDTLEARVASEKHATVSAVVEALLRPFLAARALPESETITLRVPLPVDIYNDFAAMCSISGTTAEATLIEDIRLRVQNTRQAITTKEG